jgi:phage shock protein C
MQNQKLYRTRDERMLAGVCGGLAQFFSIDPTIVRLIFVVLALMGSTGLLIYIIMWIVVPEEPLGPRPPVDMTGPGDPGL